MTVAFLIQTAVSAVAILIMAGLAWWLGVFRHPKALDEAQGRALLADEFPEARLGQVWLAADGRSMLARAGDEALILYCAGDGHVMRRAPWANVASGEVRGDRALVRLADRSAPRAAFRLGEGAVWPPVLEA